MSALLKTPGIRQLVSFLADGEGAGAGGAGSQELQANAAGAIQSISYQPKGRKHVRGIAEGRGGVSGDSGLMRGGRRGRGGEGVVCVWGGGRGCGWMQVKVYVT